MAFHNFFLTRIQEIEQTTTVDDFYIQFDALRGLIEFSEPGIPESYYTSWFINGLVTEVHAYGEGFLPVTVQDAYCLALLFDTGYSRTIRPNPAKGMSGVTNAHGVVKFVVVLPEVPSDQYDENVVDGDNVELVETHMDYISEDLTMEAQLAVQDSILTEQQTNEEIDEALQCDTGGALANVLEEIVSTEALYIADNVLISDTMLPTSDIVSEEIVDVSVATVVLHRTIMRTKPFGVPESVEDTAPTSGLTCEIDILVREANGFSTTELNTGLQLEVVPGSSIVTAVSSVVMSPIASFITNRVSVFSPSATVARLKCYSTDHISSDFSFDPGIISIMYGLTTIAGVQYYVQNVAGSRVFQVSDNQYSPNCRPFLASILHGQFGCNSVDIYTYRSRLLMDSIAIPYAAPMGIPQGIHKLSTSVYGLVDSLVDTMFGHGCAKRTGTISSLTELNTISNVATTVANVVDEDGVSGTTPAIHLHSDVSSIRNLLSTVPPYNVCTTKVSLGVHMFLNNSTAAVPAISTLNPDTSHKVALCSISDAQNSIKDKGGTHLYINVLATELVACFALPILIQHFKENYIQSRRIFPHLAPMISMFRLQEHTVLGNVDWFYFLCVQICALNVQSVPILLLQVLLQYHIDIAVSILFEHLVLCTVYRGAMP